MEEKTKNTEKNEINLICIYLYCDCWLRLVLNAFSRYRDVTALFNSLILFSYLYLFSKCNVL